MRRREEVVPASTERTEIVVLLDNSGSMSSIQRDMEMAFTTFVAEQRRVPGECFVTLVQFNAMGIKTVHESVSIQDMPSLHMAPAGGTPLLDAMGKTLTDTIRRLGEVTKVMFIVITDGEENSSREFKREQIQQLVQQRTEKGWMFVYLGANVDAFQEGAVVGASVSLSANYSPDSAGVNAVFTSAGDTLMSYRALSASSVSNGAAGSIGFSNEMREKMMPKKGSEIRKK